MRFGENSRKGASSIIIVLFVAVIALAGTAVYVALDETVLTTDGYALPGSTIEMSMEGEQISEKATIVGYYDGSYILDTESEYLSVMNVDDMLDTSGSGINVKFERSTGSVDVPGLGNTACVIYSFDSELLGISAKLTTILHGLVFSMESTDRLDNYSYHVQISDCDIVLGNYNSVSPSENTFRSSSGSTITVERVSDSIDDSFVYMISSGNTAHAFYIGNEDMVPEGSSTTQTSITVDEGVIVNLSNGDVKSISINGISYTIVNSTS